MKYSTYIDRFERHNKKGLSEFYTKVGSEFVPNYEYKFIDGIKYLVRDGEKNLDDYIQSFKDLADINVIIQKFLNGDTSVINSVVGQFGDFTNYPDTYAEMFNRVHQCERMFDSLPVEIKEKFDNSYTKFWSDFGSDYFNSVFEDFQNTDEVVPTDSVNVESEVKDA